MTKSKFEFINDCKGALDFKDVYILPQYSEVTSRSSVDTSVSVGDWEVDVPIISANMDTVTDGNMANAMFKGGGLGAIHRFMSCSEAVSQVQNQVRQGTRFFTSVGVTGDSKERAAALYDAGARWFVIDIAHGHSKMMKDMLEWMKKSFTGDDVYIMAGNVATFEGTRDLVCWGADLVKVGIGPGAVCTTKNVTGVTVPQLTAIIDCTACVAAENLAREHEKKTVRRVRLVADGGITEIGDIAKALGAGADLVMSGRLFAGCKETPGERINGKKIYRGMASRDAMLTIRDETSLPTPEGISTLIDTAELPVVEVLANIKGGLQSSFSYSNSRNLKEFHRNVLFGLRNTPMK